MIELIDATAILLVGAVVAFIIIVILYYIGKVVAHIRGEDYEFLITYVLTACATIIIIIVVIVIIIVALYWLHQFGLYILN